MIKVLIVDDSAVIRKVMTDELSRYDDIEIVGTAVDPYVARDKIVELQPDVITLDLEMPRMDGLSFLAKLMKHYPMPVVVLSSLTPKNSELALKALDLGALEVLCKPGAAYSTKNISHHLVLAIRSAAVAKINHNSVAPRVAVEAVATKNLLVNTTHKVIAIGASTGGTKAIEAVLAEMPATAPGTVIVQHMPEHFTKSFAKRLNDICPMQVREAQNNDHVVPGVALIAPGNLHMVLTRNGGTYVVRVKNGPRVHYQRPSVDVLFQSVAKNAGRNAVGVMLTGMGADGAKGMLAMKECGAHTLAQDEATCVVYGMPKEAVKLGAVDDIVALPKIPGAIISVLERGNNARRSLKKGG
ncbi:Chemotaxis response regulator protein-glutamate methylesterase CheB (EC [Olavius sp. associated proteobacterium Delta 1]|nr:Chemotaxis response regulator protein-glutamate methylesterase CheB (EC [Olavius sp. associated proteobacterium Delta 1]